MKKTNLLLIGLAVVMMLVLSACTWEFRLDGKTVAGGEAEIDTAAIQQAWANEVEADDAEIEADDAEVEADDAQPIVQDLGYDTVLTFGQQGDFHAVYDTTVGQWTLGIWETSRVADTTGRTLAELKINGDDFTFIMPFDGIINQSSGEIFVDNIQWNLGNPVVGPDMISKVIPAGSVIHCNFAGTPSDGIQIWFINK